VSKTKNKYSTKTSLMRKGLLEFLQCRDMILSQVVFVFLKNGHLSERITLGLAYTVEVSLSQTPSSHLVF